MSLLKISVAVLTYNAERCICDAITSIINQDYPGEVVVGYDEGSTDRTLQILKESLPLHRELVVFQHKHTTPSKACVYCLEKFTGGYAHL